MSKIFESTLISAENTWFLWAFVVGIAAFSIFLEQKYKWAGKLSGPVVALIFSVSLANLHIIPSEAAAYDAISEYCVPIAIVMLLFKANIRKIVKETGQAFLCFNIGALGTVIGVVVAYLIFGAFITDAGKISGVMAASYIGGGVNFFAVADTVKPAAEVSSSALVADNFVMAAAVLIGMAITGMAFFRKHFKHPHELEAEKNDGKNLAATKAAAYWGKKELSLLDIAATLAFAFAISAVSINIAELIASKTSGYAQMIIGNKFVVLTLVTLTLSSLFPKFFGEKLKGGEELGTFSVYLFFVIIGVPASLWAIFTKAPLLFVYIMVIALINIVVLLIGAKIFKLNIEEAMLASNANLGGPSTAAAVAIAKGWQSLVVPGILIGLWGYIIGTPIGIIIANLLS